MRPRPLPPIGGAELVKAGNREAAGESFRAYCPRIVIWLAISLAFGLVFTLTVMTLMAQERAYHIAARV
ncbi:hypothetical protein [Aliihoeflea sp. PC F10.4]